MKLNYLGSCEPSLYDPTCFHQILANDESNEIEFDNYNLEKKRRLIREKQIKGFV